MKLFCGSVQILANWGPNSVFKLEGIIKALISKSSRSSIMITLNGVHFVVSIIHRVLLYSK